MKINTTSKVGDSTNALTYESLIKAIETIKELPKTYPVKIEHNSDKLIKELDKQVSCYNKISNYTTYVLFGLPVYINKNLNKGDIVFIDNEDNVCGIYKL